MVNALVPICGLAFGMFLAAFAAEAVVSPPALKLRFNIRGFFCAIVIISLAMFVLASCVRR